MKDLWERFMKFMSEYDLAKIAQSLSEMDWAKLLTNPFFWLISVVLLAWVIWKKQFKLLVTLISFGAFLVLLQHQMPSPGEELPLINLVILVAGAMAVLSLNVYLYFIRGD